MYKHPWNVCESYCYRCYKEKGLLVSEAALLLSTLEVAKRSMPWHDSGIHAGNRKSENRSVGVKVPHIVHVSVGRAEMRQLMFRCLN